MPSMLRAEGFPPKCRGRLPIGRRLATCPTIEFDIRPPSYARIGKLKLTLPTTSMVRDALGGRPAPRGQSDGLCDRAVGFNDSGRNVLIPRGIVGIYSMDLL